MVQAIADRMVEVGLRLHPTKTKIVYCKDGKRRCSYENTSFTFLGFTFRSRAARAKVRRWRLHRKGPLTIGEIARRINPIVRGWTQYYGAFYRSELCPLLARINSYPLRWETVTPRSARARR